MSEEVDLQVLRRLIEGLESEDAFERRQAIESLAVVTQQRLDFSWRGSAEERTLAVKRWRKWLGREEKRRKGRQVQATIQILASGAIDQKSLEKALKDLPPAQKQALIAQVLAKVTAEAQAAGGHGVCERCTKRPATVKITSRAADGTYAQRTLCEVCAAKE